MNPTSPLQILTDFFREMINRLKTKSPTFFKVLMVIAAALTFAGYIPSMLQQWFNFQVYGSVIHYFEAVAHYATGFLVACGLTVKTDPVGKTEEGSAVKVTDEKVMPFTASREKKAMAKEVPPPETLSQVPEAKEEVKIDTSNFPDTSAIPKPQQDKP